MTIKIAINGYGRIGKNILRALYEAQRTEEIKIVAINDKGKIETNAHLTQYDTTHGYFNAHVAIEDNKMLINGDAIHMSAECDPTQLPWRALDIDVVYECTGQFTDHQSAALHLQAGAKKVLISAPGKDVAATIVYGVSARIINKNF